MSIQSEIERINNNVQTTLNTIAETGVEVGTNSDALPAAAAALANEKANKDHTHDDYVPLAGGTMTGDLAVGASSVKKNGHVIAQWFQGLANNALGSKPNRIVVQDAAGWLYSRTPEQIREDIGAAPKKVSITFAAASWTEGEEAFEQTVTVAGGTANSLIALQPTIAQIVALQGDGVAALMVDNDSGIFIARAVAAAPSADMTIQATVTEVAT